MFNLLSKIFDDSIDIRFVYVPIIAIVVLIAILVIISLNKKKFNTKCIAFAGLTIAASFALSYLKFSPVTYGGSITIASMVPICIFAYMFGFAPALLCGLIYGLLQFIQGGMYVFTYATFLLDFLLAFTSISLMAVAKKIRKDSKYAPVLGICLVYLARFLFHFMSGLIYFENGGIWASLPQDNAFIYSFLYQITYLGPDLIIAGVIIFALCATNTFKKLVAFGEK